MQPSSSKKPDGRLQWTPVYDSWQESQTRWACGDAPSAAANMSTAHIDSSQHCLFLSYEWPRAFGDTCKVAVMSARISRPSSVWWQVLCVVKRRLVVDETAEFVCQLASMMRSKDTLVNTKQFLCQVTHHRAYRQVKQQQEELHIRTISNKHSKTLSPEQN